MASVRHAARSSLALPRRAAGLVIAAVARATPRRHRFTLAVWLARAAAPLMARTSLDSALDLALYRVLSGLTLRGVEFDLRVRTVGEEKLRAALQSRDGVLIAGCHALLTYGILRFFHDAGYDVLPIAQNSTVPLWGTRVSTPALQPSRTFLVRARTRLRESGALFAMLDRRSAAAHRGVDFTTAHGPVRAADALVRVAVRTGARVVFAIARADSAGTIVMRFCDPPPGAAVAEVMADYIGFVQKHTAPPVIESPGAPRR